MVPRGIVPLVAALAVMAGVAQRARAQRSYCPDPQGWKGCTLDSEQCCTGERPKEEGTKGKGTKKKENKKEKTKTKTKTVPANVRDALPKKKASKACRRAEPAVCHAAALEKTDVKVAAADLGDACRRGHAAACRDLGVWTGEGKGVATSEPKGLVLLEHACALGDAYACGAAGSAYALGRGAPKDQKRAEELSSIACTGGIAFACANLGSWHAGTDSTKAADAYTAACDLDAIHCEAVGEFYRTGVGRPNDVEKAKAYYRKSCAANVASACGRLGGLAENAADYTTARDWYAKGCQMPSPPQWVCDGETRAKNAIASIAAEASRTQVTTYDPPPSGGPEPVEEEVTYYPPPPEPTYDDADLPVDGSHTVEAERTAAVAPAAATPPPADRPRRKRGWKLPSLPGAKLFAPPPLSVGFAVDTGVAELGEPLYGSGADEGVSGEMGRHYRLWLRSSFFPIPRALFSFGVGFHDVSRYTHDMRLEFPLEIGWNVLSWPRADRHRFSLINTLVAARLDASHVTFGVTITNVTRITCKAFVTVEYAHPIATYFADAPQLSVGLGYDLSPGFRSQSSPCPR